MLPQLVGSFPLKGSLGEDGSMRNRSGDSGKEDGKNSFQREVGREKKQPLELMGMETEMGKAT